MSYVGGYKIPVELNEYKSDIFYIKNGKYIIVGKS